MTTRNDAPPQNQLLAALPVSELSLLRPQLKTVTLDQGTVLQDPAESLSRRMRRLQRQAQQLLIRRFRNDAFGGCARNSMTSRSRRPSRVTERISSWPNLRMPAGPFQKFVRESERLRDLMIRYREFRLAETQQSVACNALHAAEGRLARWLLHTSDIIGSDIVPLTQEFLSQVLGVRRTTVTTLARNLLRTGVIRYSRGRIKICDRDQLKNFSCECYEVLHRLPAQLLPKPKR